MGLFAPQAVEHVDENSIVRDGIANPIKASRLSDSVHGCNNILILIDDGTRDTPTARLLPAVLEEIHRGGIPDDRIEFIQAPGTHRPMKRDELEKKLGALFGKYKVHEHHYQDRSSPARFWQDARRDAGHSQQARP